MPIHHQTEKQVFFSRLHAYRLLNKKCFSRGFSTLKSVVGKWNKAKSFNAALCNFHNVQKNEKCVGYRYIVILDGIYLFNLTMWDSQCKIFTKSIVRNHRVWSSILKINEIYNENAWINFLLNKRRLVIYPTDYSIAISYIVKTTYNVRKRHHKRGKNRSSKK